MRKGSLLAALVAVNFMTASLGLPLGGEGSKLSISNIAPVLFALAAGLFFFRRRETVDRRLLWFLLAFNVGCITSFYIFLARYSWDPNLPVLAFQDLELVFCALLWWYGREAPEQFRGAVKAGIILAIPLMGTYGWFDSHSGAPWMSFGMDDKSQAAVLMCCEAYILIRFFGGGLERILAVGIYVATFLTVSRLPAFFFIPIVLALMRGSRLAPLVTVVGGVIAVTAFAVAGDVIKEVFILYDRLSSVTAVTQSDSTTAHVVLLQTGLEMKFSDPLAFLFGIGPGNFSKALISFPVSLAELEAVDPVFIAFAREGRAPLHSMPLQLLLDYSLVFFLFFVFVVLKAFRFLVRRRNLADVMFFLAVSLSSIFYSLHNKPYFFLIAATVTILIANEIEALARIRNGAGPDESLALAPAASP
jgi:hypothetical protein